MNGDTLKSSEFSPIAAAVAYEIAELPADYRARLAAAGFDARRLIQLAATLDAKSAPDAAARRDARNRVDGEVLPPKPGEILEMPEPGTPRARQLSAVGEGAIRRGELAFCVMAGGMATRMGGVVKALVKAFDDHTFLDLRLGENATVSAKAGRPVPLWLMTSESTDRPVQDALAARGRTAPAHVKTFTQDLSLRLTPEGKLFVGSDGLPSAYATGHGDLPDALRRSGLLTSFRAAGGKYVWITNLDNLGATIDPVLLGMFIESGRELMAEVTEKKGDKGGIPVHARGRLQVLEEFRLPKGFDATQVDVFNCNTFLSSADALESTQIAWTYFEVEKKVEGRPAIQFERLVQELTAYLATVYVRVPREGERSRFLPVKDDAELAARREDIEAVAVKRGMVGRSKSA